MALVAAGWRAAAAAAAAAAAVAGGAAGPAGGAGAAFGMAARLPLRYGGIQRARLVRRGSDMLAALHCSPSVAASVATTAHSASSGLPPAILFLGPPGVGKGTYAARVASHLGVPHVAAGDLVRDEIESGTPLGKAVAAHIADGGMLQDEEVFELVSKRLATGDVSRTGVVLDGFPRSVRQAQMLESAARADVVVNLGMREEALVSKLLGRATCANCGASYNTAEVDLPEVPEQGKPAVFLKSLPMPEAGCRECGHTELVRRADDDEAVIYKRLRAHEVQCAGIANHYRNKATSDGDMRVVDFEITSGIPETLPLLIDAVVGPGTKVGVPAGDEATAEAVKRAQEAEAVAPSSGHQGTAAGGTQAAAAATDVEQQNSGVQERTWAQAKAQAQPEAEPAHEDGELMFVYTCGQCGTRSAKRVSKRSYFHGVVLVRCDGCKALHLVADRKGWFDDKPIGLEELVGAGATILPSGDVTLSPDDAERVKEAMSVPRRRPGTSGTNS